jgi:hypothetical protein
MGADFVHHLVYAGTATSAYNGLKSAFFSGDDSYDDTAATPRRRHHGSQVAAR